MSVGELVDKLLYGGKPSPREVLKRAKEVEERANAQVDELIAELDGESGWMLCIQKCADENEGTDEVG